MGILTDEQLREARYLWEDAFASPYGAGLFRVRGPQLFGPLLDHIDALTAQLNEARAEWERLQPDAALGAFVRERQPDLAAQYEQMMAEEA